MLLRVLSLYNSSNCLESCILIMFIHTPNHDEFYYTWQFIIILELVTCSHEDVIILVQSKILKINYI